MDDTIAALQRGLAATNQVAILDGERIRYVDRTAWDRAQMDNEAGWANALATVDRVREIFDAYVARLRAAGLVKEGRE